MKNKSRPINGDSRLYGRNSIFQRKEKENICLLGAYAYIPCMAPTIFLLHGTNSSNKVWSSEHSIVVSRLLHSFPSAHIVLFEWSGGNSNSCRLQAAELLAQYIEATLAKGSDIYAIGHSHGGNVILYSYKYFKDKSLFPKKIVCLGTPFLIYSKFNKSYFLYTLILGFSVTWLTNKFEATTWIYDWVQNSEDSEFVFDTLPFLIVFGLSYMLKNYLQKKVDPLVEKLIYDSHIDAHIRNFQYKNDEIKRWFRFVDWIFMAPYKILKRLSNTFNVISILYIVLGFVVIIIFRNQIAQCWEVFFLIILFMWLILTVLATFYAQLVSPFVLFFNILKFNKYIFGWANPLLALFSKLETTNELPKYFENGEDKHIPLSKKAKKKSWKHSNYYADKKIASDIIAFLRGT